MTATIGIRYPRRCHPFQPSCAVNAQYAVSIANALTAKKATTRTESADPSNLLWVKKITAPHTPISNKANNGPAGNINMIILLRYVKKAQVRHDIASIIL